MSSPPKPHNSGHRLLESSARGVVAGLAGSVVQAGVGHLVDRALLPRAHNNNIAPRLSARLFQRSGHAPHPVRDWLLGTLFHEFYGAGWGVIHALAADGLRVPAPVLAPAVSMLIYLVAFSSFGAGTLTGVERHPDRRDPRKQRSLIVVTATFGIATGLFLYGLEHRGHTQQS